MLSIEHLYKNFGRKAALEDVSFHVEEGQVYGLLGHNGAGKSTTLGVILAMIAPKSGDVKIGGVSVLKDRSRALSQVGAIFESPAFFDYMTGWQNLQQLMLYSGGIDKKSIEKVVDDVGLTDRIHNKVGYYSHGMRQRLALAQSLLPEPRLLLLDEPTDGLDPEGIKWFRDFILQLRKERGITVLFNSHLLSEVEQMCERVAIIKEGKLVHDGDVADIRNEETPRYKLQIPNEQRSQASVILESHGGKWIDNTTISLDPQTLPAQLNHDLVKANIAVSELAHTQRTLEDFYLSVGAK